MGQTHVIRYIGFKFSPVRRSARKLVSQNGIDMAKEGVKQVSSVKELFEETGYAYAPNSEL